jgi:hypothetical protein
MRRGVCLLVFLVTLVVAPPALASTVLLGDTNVEATGDGGTGTSEAFGYTAGASGTATAISVYLDSTSGVRVGLYADSSGKPGTRLAQGSVSSNSAGWVSVTLSTSVQVSAGTRYWLAIASSSSTTSLGYRDNGTSGSTLDYSGSGLSDPYSIAGHWNSNPASVYLTGTASSSTSSNTSIAGPTAAFKFSPASPVTGQSVYFDGSGSACVVTPCTYAWDDDGPDGPGGTNWSLGTGRTLSFVFHNAGTKYVRLTVTDAQNRTATVEHDVVVSSGGTAVPSSSSAPTVSGTAQQGDTLTTTNGSWSNSPSSYAYAWEHCDSSGSSCSVISGATSSSYMLQSSDVNFTMRSVVTATNAGGSGSAQSSPTAVVTDPPAPASPPSNTSLPTISGTTQQGQSLSATTGSWSGSPSSYVYQWQDCDSSGNNCAPISSATLSSYVLQASDVGHTVRVVVTASNASGSSSASSQQTAVVTAASSGCDRSATPSTFASQVSAATPGQTVCLASGSYGTFGGAAKAGPGYVTIMPQQGASVTMALSWTGSTFLKVDGVTITSASLSGSTHDVTVADSTFTGDLDVNVTGWSNANVVFDHNTYNNISNAGGRIEVWGNGSPTSPVGVTFSNSVISGGDADGIQLLGGEYGTQILNNTFTRLDDGLTGDGNHTDAIQIYGGTHDIVKGNFFFNQINMAGCSFAEWDGGDHNVFEDNVVAGTPNNGCYSAIDLLDDQSSTVIHNVFAYGGCMPNGLSSPCGEIMLGGKTSEGAGSGTVIRNNICTDVANGDGGLNATYSEDHNLCRNGAGGTGDQGPGTGDVKGSPTFVGGANPTTFAGFALAPGSAGIGVASDGTNIGIELPTGG